MHRPVWKRVSAAAGALSCAFLAANACTNTLQGTLNIVTGPDDGFAMDPKPTSLKVQLINTVTQSITTVAEAGLPTDAGLTLPSQAGTDIDIIQITGFDDAGDAVVSGSTIPVALDELSGISLNMFVQRTGQFSRLPGVDGGTATFAYSDASPPTTNPLMTTLYSRYLLVADGTGASSATQIYDTLTWQVEPLPPPLPTAPLSLAYVGTYTGTDASLDGAVSIAAVLSLGAKGQFSWLDLSDSQSADAEVTLDAATFPTGAQVSDVAGGQTVVTPSGMSYIVGATRATGTPTTAILRISPSGIVGWAFLTTPRLGATAVYTNGALYVFGGTALSDASTGVSGAESLVDTATAASAVNGYPDDTTTGAGAVAFDSTHVLLAGGITASGVASPVRLVDLLNPSSGGGDASTAPTLPVTLVSTQVFALAASTTSGGYTYSAVVLGSDATGASSAYLVSDSAVTPLPFRVPHTHARGIILPNGSLGVVGGSSGNIESFIR